MPLNLNKSYNTGIMQRKLTDQVRVMVPNLLVHKNLTKLQSPKLDPQNIDPISLRLA